MKFDSADLVALVRRSPAALAFLQYVVEQPRPRKEVPVDAIVEKARVDRRELVRTLRELEVLRVGRLIVGRRKQKTRFAWSERVDSLVLARETLTTAKNSAERDPGATSDPAASGDTPTVRPILHRYVLRPAFEVELRLPEDLSARESDRLAEFIRTLPFANSQDERGTR